MKVLYIHQHFSTPDGASGTRSYEFAKALLTKGHRVTMICGSHSMGETGLSGPVRQGMRRGIVDGIDVIEIDLPYSNHDGLLQRAFKFLQFAWRSIKLVFSEKFDILFATSTPLTVAIPGVLLKWLKPREKFVFEVRDSWPELPKALGVIKNPIILGMLTWLERRAYLSADALIGLSPGMVARIESIAPKKTLMMIPNGCDISFFQECSEVVELPGIEPSDFVAIFAGAHGIANGLDTVLDTAKILKDTGGKVSKIKFLFIGDGKLKVGLQARAEKEGLDNCVFLPPMAKEKLRYALKRADIGLMVLANVPEFYYGTSPNKFFDYIAAGLPVLNNYPGWLSDLITEYECGVAVPPADSECFAKELMILSTEVAQRKNNEMSANAAVLAKQFARDKLAKQFVLSLEKVYGATDLEMGKLEV